MDKPRAFIYAPNRSESPFRIENVPVGILLIYPSGGYDYKCITVWDQGELFDQLQDINWDNPEVADYIRERRDNPQKAGFWEIEVQDGDTIDTLYARYEHGFANTWKDMPE